MDFICTQCGTVQGAYKSRCKQCNGLLHTLLAQNLDRAFASQETSIRRQGIRDLGDGWWLFCDGQDWTFKVKVSYEEGTTLAERAAFTIRDLSLPADHAVSPWEFRFYLQEFLLQFASIPQRWGWEYEPLTEDILKSSAQWQESYLFKSTMMPTHTYGEATVVAASLRCLVISQQISRVWAHWSGSDFQSEDERYSRLADLKRNPRGKDTGIGPSIDAWRLGKSEQLPDSVPHDREMLPQMLQGTFQMAQRLLYRRRPQDWPPLFYVLCILTVVQGNINSEFWTNATHVAAKETKKTLRRLCHLFHRFTDNMQPLNSDLDLERYAALADDNELAVEHYRRMHQMWLDNKDGDEVEEDAADFWKNLDSFVHGMMV